MHGYQDENHQSPQPITPVRRPLAIIADDLTGACDAAVAFTSVCDPVRIQIIGEPAEPSCILAMATESRDLTAQDAELRIRNIVQRLSANTEFFKKIDSVFRGNTITEIVTVLADAIYDLAILAPAYPTLGRTIREGVLHIHDSAGHHTLPIAALLAKAHCSFTTVAADLSAEQLLTTLRHCVGSQKPVALCDATIQDDLIRVVAAARSLASRILWIGSGGLAHALAAALPPLKAVPAPQPRAGHAIFFIGSPHPVTHAQVERLRNATHIVEHRFDTAHADATNLLVPVVLGQTSADDIRRSIAALNPARVGCLFMTGGDTAHFVCRSLGIQSLRLQREFAPGVPLGIVESGPLSGVSIVLKSGGFGEPDLLCRLLETCRQEVIA